MLLEHPLVSIIIPTFNRAHLIGETLGSVLAQTYTNWECIVVDDGSTDDTDTLMTEYVSMDSRFRYYKRPNTHLPGGNGARNYGFLKSKGDLINWFDSDDLLTPNFLELKINTLQLNDVDFVVSKTKYFNKDYDYSNYYNFKEQDVSFENFATTHMNWCTPDTLVKKKCIESISYNEHLKAGQEYNFICKLLLKTTSMSIVDHFLTLRRAHDTSISASRVRDNSHYLKSKFYAYWITYKDLNELANSKKFNTFCLLKCVLCFLSSGNTISLPKTFSSELYKVFKFKVFAFYLALISNRFIGKYNFFYNFLK